ncbi:hypothetical protein [uncultured Rikenella sp.]|uniref:hypothetical protein n=1 Tax=uncultured Rikenella sp. TaxID=368003 RepID=UPI0025FCB692|nr:hypothetical protein [uncultured Rikenella sp.]
MYKVSSDGTAGTPLAWYPAPGYRHNNTGESGNGGNGGYNWSSTVRDTYGIRLDFGIMWLNPGYAYSRGYGFSLRCLSE